MPKLTFLSNQHITVEKGQEVDQSAVSANGAPVLVDTWTIVFTDKTYGDQIRITFRKETRDEVVRLLTGGIVLAGGDLPSV